MTREQALERKEDLKRWSQDCDTLRESVLRAMFMLAVSTPPLAVPTRSGMEELWKASGPLFLETPVVLEEGLE